MSSTAQGGPSVPKDAKEKKGISKLLSRARTVLKTRRLSTFSTKGAAAAEAPTRYLTLPRSDIMGPFFAIPQLRRCDS